MAKDVLKERIDPEFSLVDFAKGPRVVRHREGRRDRAYLLMGLLMDLALFPLRNCVGSVIKKPGRSIQATHVP